MAILASSGKFIDHEKYLKNPVRIAITGAAGAIGYALTFRIAAGDMFGREQAVILHLIEIEAARRNVEALMMELEDCAFPLLRGCNAFFDPFEGFAGVDYALLIGSRPRTQGMERKDLLEVNGEIFSSQGRALNESASRNVRVLVVGNPANTNALIALYNAPGLTPSQFTCMLRLDHNRAKSLLAKHLGCHVSEVQKMTVWGNHSSTQFPDISYCTVGGKPASELVEKKWLEDKFIPAVQQRGARIIETRGTSSAASAASAVIDHMHTWVSGTADGDWTSMGVFSDGDYGTPPGVMFSFPIVVNNGQWQIVQGLEIDEFSRRRLDTTAVELSEERSLVELLLKP